ncbi:MAG: class I SAM-dependent methyltransferase [Pseudomonadota bacterium]
MTTPDYQRLRAYYERCLDAHGATLQGVDWPRAADAATRYAVMRGLVRPQGEAFSILDVGCGPGFFHDALEGHFAPGAFAYHGIDISPAMVAAAKARRPHINVEARDLVAAPLPGQSVDYAVLNGVFTVRERLSEAAMLAFAEALLASVFNSCRMGLAVNFMAPHADWRDDKLFYLSLDKAMQLFKARLSRHVVLRLDYGLWEYTAYVYRQPATSSVTKS